MADKWDMKKLAKVGYGVELEGMTQRSLEDYGKKVVVTQEDFQKSINASAAIKEKYRDKRDPNRMASSHFLNKFTAQQKQRLNQCFKKYSTQKTVKKPARSRLNANGVRQVVVGKSQTSVTISQSELGKLFEEALIPLHSHTLGAIFTQMVQTRGGELSFDDVIEILDLENGSLDSQADLRHVFDVYDRKRRGFFEFQDYKLVCKGIEKDLTDSQMRHAFRGMDEDNTGKITYDKFVRVMKGIH